MTKTKIKIGIMLLLLTTVKLHAQQSCYQIGLNEGREIYNEAQRLERSGRCVEAVPQFWEALRRFRLTRSCRDLPANHELDTWEDRCIQGIAACGGKSDESTFLIVSQGSLSFTEKGGSLPVTINTNSNAWRVERIPAWCTTQRSNNILTVICGENTGTDSRRENLVIVANTLRYEITIEQAGKPVAETPAAANITVTQVRFAGKYADGTTQNYGGELFNNLALLLPRITLDHTATESQIIKLDFKIIAPNGRLLAASGSEYTYSEEFTLRSNLQRNAVFDVPEWGSTFAETGIYRFEIWRAGANLFSAGFEIFPKPIPQVETVNVDPSPIPYTSSYVSPASPASPTSTIKASVGIKAGLNLANISNSAKDINFTPEMKPDFHAGIFLNINFGFRENTPGLFGLQPEVLYSRQGFAVNGDRINFDYITVPIIIKLYAYQGINFELGTWFSYLLSVSPDVTVIDRSNIKLSDLKGGKDVGITAGVGYDFNYGLVVGVRYLHGLSDMANNLQWTNSIISISLGWKF